MVALAGRPRKFRGKQGYAIIDEGAHVDDLDELLTAAVPFIMWGGPHRGHQHASRRIKSIQCAC